MQTSQIVLVERVLNETTGAHSYRAYDVQITGLANHVDCLFEHLMLDDQWIVAKATVKGVEVECFEYWSAFDKDAILEAVYAHIAKKG